MFTNVIATAINPQFIPLPELDVDLSFLLSNYLGLTVAAFAHVGIGIGLWVLLVGWIDIDIKSRRQSLVLKSIIAVSAIFSMSLLVLNFGISTSNDIHRDISKDIETRFDVDVVADTNDLDAQEDDDFWADWYTVRANTVKGEPTSKSGERLTTPVKIYTNDTSIQPLECQVTVVGKKGYFVVCEEPQTNGVGSLQPLESFLE